MFLNLGHFIDHLLMLVFATAAALALVEEWNMSYSELIPYATPGFIAFGIFSLPAGWFADKWSRTGMMIIFFFGIGISTIATALANSPFQLALGLFAVGAFGAIYHPVGIPLVIEGYKRTGVRIAINGVFGNFGVASAALLTGYFVDHTGWRSAFVWPGIVTIVIGIGYAIFLARYPSDSKVQDEPAASENEVENEKGKFDHRMFIRIFAIVLFTTAIGSLIFQSATFTLPKLFDERLSELAVSATVIGWYAFLVFSVASLGQLIVGYLIDRLQIRFVFSIIAILQIIFFVAMIDRVGPSALLIAMAFMLMVFGQIPINDVLLGRITNSKWRSRAYGLRFVIAFTVMALALPLVAWIYSRGSFNMIFIAMAFAGITIMITVMMLPRDLKPKLQRSSVN